MESIKVVILEPGKMARIAEIEKGLKSYQSIVNGYIEVVYPFDDEVCIVCNEEGKINGLPLNRGLFSDGELYDIIAGTCFICGCSGEDLGSLNDELAEKYRKMFESPERFVRDGEKIFAIAYKP